MMGIPERAFETYTSVLQPLNDIATIDHFKEEFGSLYPVVETIINSFNKTCVKPQDEIFFKFIKGQEEEDYNTLQLYSTSKEWSRSYLLSRGGVLENITSFCYEACASFYEMEEENTFKKDEVDNNTFISTSEDPRSPLVKAYINKFPELESVVLKILEVFERSGLVNHNTLVFNIKAWDEGSAQLNFRDDFGWTSSIGLRLNNPDLLSNLTGSLQGLIMGYSKRFADKAGFHMNPFTTPFNHQYAQPTGFVPNNGFGGYRSPTEAPGDINEEYSILNNPVVQNVIRKEVTKRVNSQLTAIQQRVDYLHQQTISLQQQIEFMKFNLY